MLHLVKSATLKVVFLGLIIGALGQDSAPQGPQQPGTVSNCNEWCTVKAGDSCSSVEKKFKISHAQFVVWNPAVSQDCLSNFWTKYSHCVGVGVKAKPTSTSKKTTSTSRKSESVTSTSKKTTSTSRKSESVASTVQHSTNTTKSASTPYSIRNPITSHNLTTPTIDRTWPPTKTQAGQPSYCNKWYLVDAPDTCENIPNRFGLSTDEFLKLNPALSTDCSGLYYGWWVCVGIQSRSSLTIPWPPETGNVSIPTFPPYTPHTYPTINSSFIVAPTQTGLASDCQGFYQATSGDTCTSVLADFKFITKEQFFLWNPALKGNCDGVSASYWYCVADFPPGKLPLPPTVKTAPSPIESGIADDCVSWYQMTLTDTCDSIAAMFGTFFTQDFIKWNPGVSSDCSKIKQGYYYCVAVPGTPKSRSAPIPTVQVAETTAATMSATGWTFSTIRMTSTASPQANPSRR